MKTVSDELDDIQWEFLVEGLDDYVGLWEWVKEVRHRSPDPEDVRAEVLRWLGSF